MAVSVVFSSYIRDIIEDKVIPWGAFRNSAVLITGATGLVGGALARALSAASAAYGLNMRIFAHGRNKDKGEALARNNAVEFISGDIREPLLLENSIADLDYIFHCAAITKSADMIAKPVDVISTMLDGARNVLELARKRKCRGIVYLSSMEIYGRTEKKEVCERDLGYLDLLALRSSYPESKRLCEALCASYAAQHGVPVKIARLAQTFGAGTPKDDTRVFAQFARSAINGADIELHTQGASRGNYCCVADTVRGLLLILHKGESGEAYNVANPAASMTIREMAELVADNVADGNIKVVVKIPDDIQNRGYAPESGYTLSAEKLKSLGWRPKYGLADMYRHMIADWKEY